MLSGLKKPKRTAVFISGGGSTLQSLLEMHHQIDIRLVVSNRKSAVGLLKAKRFGKTTHLFSKESNFFDLHQVLKKHNIEQIILAGFMKILPADFVNLWRNRMINIHPSLLPKYPGLNSAERAWHDNNTIGVSLHRVTEEMDAGEVLLQINALKQPKNLDFSEASIFLRRTEQHLLRQLVLNVGLI